MDVSSVDFDVFCYRLARKLAYLHFFGHASPQGDHEENYINSTNVEAVEGQNYWSNPCTGARRPSNANEIWLQKNQEWETRSPLIKFDITCNSDYGSSENGSVVDPLDCGDGQNSANKSFEELANAFRPEIPRPGYVCNICRIPGHFIQYCHQAPTVTKTPYQGSKQCIGLFICHKCKRQWKSNKSFAGVGQQCKKCHVIVHPKKQFPLRCPPRSLLGRHNVDQCPSQTVLVEPPPLTPVCRTFKPLPSLTSDFFESCSALPTPSPSPFSLRQFIYE